VINNSFLRERFLGYLNKRPNYTRGAFKPIKHNSNTWIIPTNHAQKDPIDANRLSLIGRNIAGFLAPYREKISIQRR